MIQTVYDPKVITYLVPHSQTYQKDGKVVVSFLLSYLGPHPTVYVVVDVSKPVSPSVSGVHR